MFVYLEKSYIFALLLFGCKNPSVRNVFSISFPLRVLMSKFFFSVFISVVLTSLETQLVLSKNPHHGEDFYLKLTGFLMRLKQLI